MPDPCLTSPPDKCIKHALRHMHASQAHSWFYAEPEFQAAMQAFRANENLFATGKVIWKLSNRCVRRVTLPPELGGHTLAIKCYEGNKQLRYAFHPSKTAVEAANYRIFASLGLPMAKLAFVGDLRTCFYLKRSYLATQFVENSQDGRAFTADGDMHNTPEQQDFINQVVGGLAKLHAVHCFHRGAHVYNFLWRLNDRGKLQTTWIDVASCRFKTVDDKEFTHFLIGDLADFFRDLDLTDTQLTMILKRYKQINKHCILHAPELLQQVKEKTLEARIRLQRQS